MYLKRTSFRICIYTKIFIKEEEDIFKELKKHSLRTVVNFNFRNLMILIVSFFF